MNDPRKAKSVVVRTGGFDSVKVFSATMHNDRAQLGERVTEWLATHAHQVTEFLVMQSSDASFHCVTIVVLYRAQ